MDLIKELGGYEKAKQELQDYDGILFGYSYELKQALLRYRRENNIFEVGDKVVSTLEGLEDWKNAVCEILGFYKEMAITTGFSCAIHHYNYRHATSEEIKANKRL